MYAFNWRASVRSLTYIENADALAAVHESLLTLSGHAVRFAARVAACGSGPDAILPAT